MSFIPGEKGYFSSSVSSLRRDHANLLCIVPVLRMSPGGAPPHRVWITFHAPCYFAARNFNVSTVHVPRKRVLHRSGGSVGGFPTRSAVVQGSIPTGAFRPRQRRFSL